MKDKIRIDNYNICEDMEYTTTLETDKAKVKYVKKIEHIIRSSMEYRDYISYLKEYVDMNHCEFFTNIQNSQGSKVRIEIHHEPLTLYDIVYSVVNKFIAEGIPLNDLFIADEVMDIHYRNMVGLIPLSKSLHQIIHNSDEIIIPLNIVYGNYRQFLIDYEDYLDETAIEKIERKISQTKNIKREMFDKLNPQFVYINVDGYDLPQKVEISRGNENT
jgi:hypothetical protein